MKSVCDKYEIAPSVIYRRRTERKKKEAEKSVPLEFVSYGACTDDAAPPQLQVATSHSLTSTTSKAYAQQRQPEFVRPHLVARTGSIEIALLFGYHLVVDSFVNEISLARVLRCLAGNP